MGESDLAALKDIKTKYVTQITTCVDGQHPELMCFDWTQLPGPTQYCDVLKSEFRALPLTRAAH